MSWIRFDRDRPSPPPRKQRHLRELWLWLHRFLIPFYLNESSTDFFFQVCLGYRVFESWRFATLVLCLIQIRCPLHDSQDHACRSFWKGWKKRERYLKQPVECLLRVKKQLVIRYVMLWRASHILTLDHLINIQFTYYSSIQNVRHVDSTRTSRVALSFPGK